MAGSPVLVDSSYYIALCRARLDPLAALAPVAAVRDLATCGVVRCEVARGIRDAAVLRTFQRFWDCMLEAPTDAALWREVEAALWRLDRAGIQLPLQDVVIAACARRVDAVVLTFDRHFAAIPGCVAVDRIA